MKKRLLSALLVTIIAWCAPTLKADSSSYLPIVENNGKKCYYYSVEKGESAHGIANKFGWEIDVFMKYNPKATELKSGMVVYYPCEAEAPSSAPVISAKDFASLSAKVSDSADAAVANGQKHGGPAEGYKPGKPVFYKMRPGDKIRDIARSNNMSVYKLFKLNPGLTVNLPEQGTKLMILPGSDMEQAEYRTVSEKVPTHYKNYKVKQKDTWSGIATKHHIDTIQLHAANPGIKMLQKGTKIRVPVMKDTLVDKWVPVVDPREATKEGLEQIYREAHTRILKSGEFKDNSKIDVFVTVTADDAAGRRRDLEFLKGLMLGLTGKKFKDGMVKLNAVDLADYGSLQKALTSGDFDNADIIISTVDKDIPPVLVDFCRTNNITLINVFDAKTDLSEILPEGVQLLPPSSYFYDRTADFLSRVMHDRVFLFIGRPSDDDESMSGSLYDRLKESGVTGIKFLDSTADLEQYKFNPAKSYTIVSDAGSKDEINSTLRILNAVVDKYPNMPLSIVGRASWIVYSKSLEKSFRKLDTYIPSRFYYDEDSEQSKRFTSEFVNYYRTNPLKTLPMYSAMGYDVADYLLYTYYNTRGDLNNASPAENQLQLDFRLSRPELYEGFLNRRVYLLHFTPFSTTEKISM